MNIQNLSPNSLISLISKVTRIIIMQKIHSLKNEFIRADLKKYKYTQFHSQFGEDRYIAENINLPKEGTFIDVGAGHPTFLSNTYFFEKNGWNGVCIDADPTQAELLRRDRKQVEEVAISAEEGELEFSLAATPEYSSTFHEKDYKGLVKIPFKDTVRVPTLRLETVLEKYHIDKIDILDIDVEGTELEVWKTFEYQKHQPKVVIIEYYTYGLKSNSDNSKKIKDFFADLPYRLVHTTCTNLIFLKISE